MPKSPGITLNIEENNNVNPLKSATATPKIETDDGFKTFNEIL